MSGDCNTTSRGTYKLVCAAVVPPVDKGAIAQAILVMWNCLSQFTIPWCSRKQAAHLSENVGNVVAHAICAATG